MKNIMMNTRIAILVLLVLAPAFGKDPAYEPLWLYKGAWKGTRKAGNAAPVTNTIKNDCALAGRFFVCQQTVDGKPGALLIFVPAGSPGSYYTQAVLQEGFATGRGELRIEGNRWTYSSKAERNGKTTYHRTTNVFTGKDRIHSEQLESNDSEHWTITATGDLVRVRK
jgi:hypothetical protein